MAGNLISRDKMRNTIFQNVMYLSVGYIPSRLVGRDEEIKIVAENLYPAFYGTAPNNMLIYGKQGIGKSVVVRYVLEEFKTSIKEYRETGEFEINCIPVYIECNRLRTVSILNEIIRQIDLESILPPSGLATEYYYDRLWEVMNERNTSIIIVLDEIDKLRDDTILYFFSRSKENFHLKENLFISIIGITNDINYKKEVDPRILSSLGQTDIVFPVYNVPQLTAILEDRAKDAFNPGVLDEPVIPLCAALSAQDHGDARRAIKLLRQSGVEASQDKTNETKKKVTEEHVKQAAIFVERDNVKEFILRLSLQEQVVLLSVALQMKYNPDEINTTSTTYRTYKDVCERIDLKPLSQTRISNIVSEQEMAGIIKTRRLKTRGRSREVWIENSSEEVIRYVAENPRINLNLPDDQPLEKV